MISAATDDGKGEESPSERVLVIQGIFNPEGDSPVSLEPVFSFPRLSQATPLRQRGRFALEITDEAGKVTRALFDALVADDSGEEGEERHGFFEIMLAAPSDRAVVSLRIADAEGARVFGGCERSQPPQIIITAPESGAWLGDTTRIARETRDPDTPQQELLCQLAFSPDAGRSCVPIGVDVKGTSFTFDSTEIPRSQGSGGDPRVRERRSQHRVCRRVRIDGHGRKVLSDYRYHLRCLSLFEIFYGEKHYGTRKESQGGASRGGENRDHCRESHDSTTG